MPPVRAVVDAWGGVDVLVNAAARPASSAPVPALADLEDDALRAEVETKVLGYLRCARAVAPHMTGQGWGRIVNVSGLNARATGNWWHRAQRRGGGDDGQPGRGARPRGWSTSPPCTRA